MTDNKERDAQAEEVQADLLEQWLAGYDEQTAAHNLYRQAFVKGWDAGQAQLRAEAERLKEENSELRRAKPDAGSTDTLREKYALRAEIERLKKQLSVYENAPIVQRLRAEVEQLNKRALAMHKIAADWQEQAMRLRKELSAYQCSEPCNCSDCVALRAFEAFEQMMESKKP